MKKLLCAILAAVMLLSACGCAAFTEIMDEAMGTADAGTNENGVEFSIGEWDGDVYTNDFAELTFTQPENWIHLSDEELAELMSVSLENTVDNDMAAKIAELSTSYALMAMSNDNGSNAQIMFENLAVTGSKNMEPAAYINIVCANLKQQYADTYDFDTKVGDIETYTIGDNEYTSVLLVLESEGTPVMEQMYLVRKIDKYMASIALTSLDHAGIEAMLECFE